MTSGHKCLLTCRCFLPQYKRLADPPLHQFVVFVKIIDDKVEQKFVQCNNCGIIHRVVDVCKSEFVEGKESSAAIVTIDDVKQCIGSNIAAVLENNSADLSTWELAQFYVENEMWGQHVVLSQESDGKIRSGKVMRILGMNLVRVESFMHDEVF